MTRPISDLRYLRLIQLFLHESSDEPTYYFLWYEGDTELPIAHHNSPILFADKKNAPIISSKYASHLQIDELDITNPFMVYDIPSTLSFLVDGGVDTECCVLNTVNLLLDFISVLNMPMLQSARPALNNVADFATFNMNMTDLLHRPSQHNPLDRVQSLLMIAGAIIVRSHIYRNCHLA